MNRSQSGLWKGSSVGLFLKIDSNIQNEIGKGEFNCNQGYSNEARVREAEG